MAAGFETRYWDVNNVIKYTNENIFMPSFGFLFYHLCNITCSVKCIHNILINWLISMSYLVTKHF